MVQAHPIAERDAALARDLVLAFALVGERNRLPSLVAHYDVLQEVGLAIFPLRGGAGVEQYQFVALDPDAGLDLGATGVGIQGDAVAVGLAIPGVGAGGEQEGEGGKGNAEHGSLVNT